MDDPLRNSLVCPKHREDGSKTNRKAIVRVSLRKSLTSTEHEHSSEIMTDCDNNVPASPAPIGRLNRFKLRLKQISSSSFNNSSLEDSVSGIGNGSYRVTRKALKAPSKLLTNIATNWKLKSQQSKNERRERRATKTLVIVLGMF